MSRPKAPADDGEALDQFLCFAIYSAGFAFNRVYKPLLDELGITYPQYLVLILLGQRDDRTVGELAETLFLESSTLTPLLKRLEGAGLVTRKRDGTDERVVRVSLTKKGSRVAEQAACVPAQILEATGMSVDELSKINASLIKLRTNLRG